jgi:hypothetical protein
MFDEENLWVAAPKFNPVEERTIEENTGVEEVEPNPMTIINTDERLSDPDRLSKILNKDDDIPIDKNLPVKPTLPAMPKIARQENDKATEKPALAPKAKPSLPTLPSMPSKTKLPENNDGNKSEFDF